MLRQALLGVVFTIVASQVSAEPYPSGQGWSQAQAHDWYDLTQGSRMIPMDWFKHLQRPDGAVLYDRKTFEDYGLLYFPESKDTLPVGFVEDVDENGRRYLGLNCSACHTSKLSANGKSIVVHGGSTMSDFQRFTKDVIDAVDAVSASDAARLAFATKLGGHAPDADNLTILKEELKAWLDLRHSIHDTANGSHWGIGRSDAVGIILATVAKTVDDPSQPSDSKRPFPESNAPVSYPFAWNANQQARLQHNGVVDNGTDFGVFKGAKIGALIRNWTEAFGVFATSKLSKDGALLTTSVRLDNLLKIEQALAGLQSPQWPAEFGAIDADKATRGKLLYQDNCSSCHGLLDPTDTTTSLPLIETPGTSKDNGFIYLQPLFAANARPEDFKTDVHPNKTTIGTDPGMACNAMSHVVPTGLLKGQRNKHGITGTRADKPFGDEAVSTDLLRVLIQRDIFNNKIENIGMLAENQWDALGDIIVGWLYQPFEDEYQVQGTSDDPLEPLRVRIQNCVAAMRLMRAADPEAALPVYKARPLNGIWATAPFLHNGSVPSIDDLLKTQTERPVRFGLIDGEMDVEKLGLKDRMGEPGADIFNVYGEDGTVITGNWNGGHEYGASLTADQRRDLIEYIKGL